MFDQNLQAPLTLAADYLVLSAAVRPNPGSVEMAQIFKLPFDVDGFFLEAHLKLRPLDFATQGIFLCGLAHSPKYADEAVAQAQGAAARAMGILAQEEMLVGGAIARVIRNRCARCLTCVRVCPLRGARGGGGGGRRPTSTRPSAWAAACAPGSAPWGPSS